MSFWPVFRENKLSPIAQSLHSLLHCYSCPAVPGPLRAAHRSFHRRPGVLQSATGLERGSRRPAAVSARLSPSGNGVDRGRPLAVRPWFRPRPRPLSASWGGFSPAIPGFDRGFSPSVPLLGRPLAVRPGLDRDSRRGLSPPASGLDRAFCRPSPVSPGLSPSVPGPHTLSPTHYEPMGRNVPKTSTFLFLNFGPQIFQAS